MPAPLKIGIVLGMAGALIHPRSRERIIRACKTMWKKVNNPGFRSALSSLILQLAEADQAM
jgi:hypothetical protein